MYNMAASEYQPEYFPEHDKKNLSLQQPSQQPDLTQTVVGVSVPPCYEYPYSDPPNSKNGGLSRSCSEHHYDVPHLSSPPGDPPTSPSTSSHSMDSSSCPVTATPPVETSSEKPAHSDSNHSISSFCSSSSKPDSTYDIAAQTTTPTTPPPSIIAGVDPECIVSATVTSAGARLSLPESGISLSVPEGALSRGQREDVFLAVLREDRHRPKLSDRQTQLSPVVICGPANVAFKKPVIVNFHHCASLKHGHWSVSVWCSYSQPEEPPVWQKVVTLGEETINTPVFTQLDHGQVYLVTDQLTRFVLVGESAGNCNKAVKTLRLAVFAPSPILHPQSLDYNVRVYTLEDNMAALEGVLQMEKKLGGCLMDKPKTMLFQDGGASLCLSMEDIGPGWKSKPQADYQEIPFHHIWSSSHNHLHCSFTLECTDRLMHTVAFRILACQKGSQTHRQMFKVNTDLHTSVPNMTVVPSSPALSRPPRALTVTTSSGCSSMVTTLDPTTTSPFRLHRSLRKQLCLCLDPPNARGNDWRMLAQSLNVDRYINYFATKASPTGHILDLWEARHRDPTAVTDLLNILRVMGRSDAASLLEKELGPWI
ncbi:netrin receptor UNC5B [Cryptotermes secundus]|uniref:netrin receptor UNC5B n=1 Tax=Cryptotermes secundus TaxID=105785 RepID=UPI000CD7D962|nr:netrin receptor UNC5B [Cryptotermes secundus]